MADEKVALGIDVGGTFIKAALCTRDGEVRARSSTDTVAREGYESVLHRIIWIVEDVLDRAGAQRSDVAGVGIGLAGRIDPRSGDAVMCPNLPGFVNVPVARPLEDNLGLKAKIGNDAGCAALGEFFFGAGKGSRDMVMLTLGTGIGGAVILDGKPRRGERQVLGEIGHCVIDVDGPECSCTQHGCLEAFCGTEGIVRRTRQRLQRGRASKILDLSGGDGLRITPQVVAEAAKAGDAVAIEVLEETGFYLGAGIVNAVVFCDPDVVVIGGKIADAGEHLFGPLRRTVEARCRIGQFRGDRIVKAKLGGDAGVVGAASLVLEPETGIQPRK